MTEPATAQRFDRRSSSSGFALVVALSMMAFILLLIVSLSTLLQVDLKVSSQSLKQLEARQNAQLGIQMALQQLQTYTGPDQRVTARADLLDPNATHPYWTGAWHAVPEAGADSASFEGGSPEWLVSSVSGSNEPNPLVGLAPERAVELVVGTSGGTTRVRVEKVPIRGQGDSTMGHYAYWVGDEGIKTHIRPHEPAAFADIAPASVEQLRRLAMAHQPRWETLLTPGFELTLGERERLLSLEQLNHRLNPSAGNTVVSERFHDLTAYSSSLLTDTRRGGLKKDLSRILGGSTNPTGESTYNSTAAIAPDDFSARPTWGLLRSFYNLGQDLGAEGAIDPAVPVRAQTDTQHGVFPVLTMVQMNWSARVDPVEVSPETHRLQVIAQPVLALANPYNVRLAPATYTLRLEYERPGSFEGRLQLLWQLDNPGLTLRPDDNIFGDDDIVLRVEDVGFEPGEARIFSLGGDLDYSYGSGGITLSPGLNLLTSVFINFQPATFVTQTELNGPSKISGPGDRPMIRARMQWAPVIAELTAEPQTGSEQLVQRIERIIYSSSNYIDTPAEWPSAANPPNNYNALPNKLKLRHSNHPITTVPGTTSDQHSGARWLALYNLRAPESEQDPDGFWVTNPLYDGQPRIESYPAAPSDGSNAFWGPDINGMQTHVALFDIPRQPIISLGTLQHANLSPESWMPAYPFANSWASPYYAYDERDLTYALNEALWDGYFFSGLPENASLDDVASADWANTRLRPQPLDLNPPFPQPLAWDTAAAHLTLEGGFNVNSTSEAAWTALLKSLKDIGVPYLDPVSGGGVQVDDSDSSVPYPRAEVPSGDSAATDSARWRGFKSLGESAIEELADAIVREVRNRGPFRSLADFVNRRLDSPENSDENLKGALQAAIDNTPINDWWRDNDPQVPSFGDRISGSQPLPRLPYPEAEAGPRSTAAPGYLTQADLLQVLAPVIQARSETFRLRAYGSTTNPLTGEPEAEAWCEAVVQRVSEYINPDDTPDQVDTPSSPLAEVNQRFGRRYKVLAFRWLQSNEL